jgi:hypothetical protein
MEDSLRQTFAYSTPRIMNDKPDNAQRGFSGFPPQHLNRRLAAESCFGGAPDDAHAAGGDLGKCLVLAGADRRPDPAPLVDASNGTAGTQMTLHEPAGYPRRAFAAPTGQHGKSTDTVQLK